MLESNLSGVTCVRHAGSPALYICEQCKKPCGLCCARRRDGLALCVACVESDSGIGWMAFIWFLGLPVYGMVALLIAGFHGSGALRLAPFYFCGALIACASAIPIISKHVKNDRVFWHFLWSVGLAAFGLAIAAATR